MTRPAWPWFVLLDGGIVTLTALAASEEAHRAASEASPVGLPDRPTLRRMLVATAAIHVGEALVAHRIARRHGLAAGAWARQTFVVGFPSLLALRRRIA